ncbi:tyrosine-protein phosphatase [Desulfitobacterium sp. LBE]|uniref:tyrosine-protein phosphatase n=1 Tax=Desulfitobacterium sp. LBE TaxID=884086 RepID=UPI0011A035EB|nr:tyrosine-protein phosphatase [Desulfitobacterium sp. LBE]
MEWDVIEQEYLLSNTAYAGSVDISSLRFYLSVIEENYLRDEMALDENDFITLREKYTISAN